ncbi:hypothetical protein Bca4012_068287 [Brassica carinata]
MDTNCEADLSWSRSFAVDYGVDVYSCLFIDERKKVALCDSYYGERMNVFGHIQQDNIESDVFGKSPHSRYDRSERDDSETWEYYCQLQQEIDEILNSAFKEWDQWEIECTDYSSIRRSRGRGWKTR